MINSRLPTTEDGREPLFSAMIASTTKSRAFLFISLLALSAPLLAQTVPSSNFSLIKDAAQAIAAGKLDLAETDLQAVLRRDPKDYRALNLLGVVRAQEHREKEAEQLFKQAIVQKPDFASAHMDLGLLYSQMNRGDEAEAEFQETLKLDPSRTDARDSLVNLYQSQATDAVHSQNLEKALSLVIKARNLSPKDHDVLFKFGMIALRMSLYPDAIQAFDGALQVQNNDSRAIYGLGRAQIGLTRFQDAGDHSSAICNSVQTTRAVIMRWVSCFGRCNKYRMRAANLKSLFNFNRSKPSLIFVSGRLIWTKTIWTTRRNTLTKR